MASRGRLARVLQRLQFDLQPEKAARQILEIANSVEPVQGRIHIEKINGPILFGDRGTVAEYSAGMKLAIDRGWQCADPGRS